VNILSAFLENAPRWGDRPAIVAGDGETLTFGELERRSARLAAGWRARGVRAETRVLLALPLGLSLYAAIAALWRLGATIVFPEPALGLRGLRNAAEATKPEAFLASGLYRALALLPEIRRAPIRLSLGDEAQGGESMFDGPAEHPALISFTSGSTGRPKAILRTHGFLAAQNACIAQFLRPKTEPQVDLVAFPVFVIANLGLGVTSALPDWRLSRHDRADAASIARLIEARGATRALIPPSIAEIIAGGPPAPRLRTVFTGGGPVFPDTLKSLSDRLKTSDIVAIYGSTEAEPIAEQAFEDIRDDDWTKMREGDGLLAGRPIPQVRVELLGDEIIVAGDHVNKGYLDPSLDAETKLKRDGEIWHRTGDAGRFDAEDRLWLLGRVSAKAGRFYPFMAEAAARKWPGVRQAALVPASDPPTLAIAGDARGIGEWRERAQALGDVRIVAVDAIPLDRRHRSKVDYDALACVARRRV